MIDPDRVAIVVFILLIISLIISYTIGSALEERHDSEV